MRKIAYIFNKLVFIRAKTSTQLVYTVVLPYNLFDTLDK
jgi:hypothetical protein